MLKRILLTLVVLMAAIVVLPPVVTPLLGLGPSPTVRAAPGTEVAISNGNRINVVETGEGTPVVLIHGLPSCAGDWAKVPQELAKRGYRAIAYDRVGFGYSSRSEPGSDRYTYDSNAEDLEALLDALEIERAVLVGWSYGGGVVQALALRAPERIRGAVLIGSVGPLEVHGEMDDLDAVMRSGFGSTILEWIGSLPPLSRAMTQANLDAAFSRPADVPPGWNEYTRAMLALDGTFESFELEWQRGKPATLQPEKLTVPTLVLHGDDDRLVPVAVAEDLAGRLPDAELVLVPDGSHMLPVTNAVLVADHIDRLAKRAAVGPQGTR